MPAGSRCARRSSRQRRAWARACSVRSRRPARRSSRAEAGMLKGIDPLLGPDLLHTLAAMGHGDEIAIVDANFPAASTARRLVRIDGAGAPAVLSAVLSLLPLD